ncbi:MAG: ABC transporter permease [Bacteroidia bacterium]
MEDKKIEGNEEWSLVVKPTSGWFDLHLSDVWRYRDLIMLFVRRDFVSVYKQTILGPAWFVIQPILTTIMFMVVFGGIAKIPTDGIPGALFYLSGLTVWNYFATCFNKTSSTFLANAAIFGKVYFPRLAAPVSSIISSMISLMIQFLLFILVFIYFILFKSISFHFNMYMLLIPYLIVIMGGLGLGFGIIISSLTTKYRDLTYLVGFGVQLIMYATPVVYPLSLVKDTKFRMVVLANPMSSIVETFRYAFFPKGEFHWLYLAYSSIFMLIILFFGVLLFNRTEKNFMDTV